ncbi:MAG TPA: ABC transporter substrate-binding protein, partial [bacterium]
MAQQRGRGMLKGMAVLAALVVAGALGLGRGSASAEDLRIGIVAPMTGIFAQIGADMVNGMQMYLDEVNSDFAGAKVTMIVEDTQGKPPINVQKAQKLVRQDKVHMFIGGLLASSGYALAPVSTRSKVLYIMPVAAADDLTQRQEYPYLLRTGWTSSMPSHPFGEWACDKGYKRIAAIGA